MKSIVNGYPVNATAFSVTDAVFDTRTIPESYIFLREVQRIPYGLQFQEPEQLAEAFPRATRLHFWRTMGCWYAGRASWMRLIGLRCSRPLRRR